MTRPHNVLSLQLAYELLKQLEGQPYEVRSQSGHLATASGGYRVPDLAVLPLASAKRFRESYELEEYAEPLSFVAEVWSRSTGDFDVETKFPEYRQRGDAVIWRVHPYERTVIIWERRPDGGYDERLSTAGRVTIPSLPGVSIDLDALFRAL